MTDSQDPGATQVLPATPPPTPPSPPSAPAGAPTPSPKKGIPWWVALLVALFFALVGGCGTWAVLRWMNTAPTEADVALEQENAALKKQVEDLVEQFKSLPATDSAKEDEQAGAGQPQNNPPAGGAPSTADDGKQFAYVKSISQSGGAYTIVLDFAQFLTGAQAAAAAAAHGDESPPPNDYYIVNDNPKLRTFPVQAGISVKVLNWAGNDATAPSTIPFAQWAARMPGGSNPQDEWIRAPYWVTISGGVAVKIEQQYLP